MLFPPGLSYACQEDNNLLKDCTCYHSSVQWFLPSVNAWLCSFIGPLAFLPVSSYRQEGILSAWLHSHWTALLSTLCCTSICYFPLLVLLPFLQDPHRAYTNNMGILFKSHLLACFSRWEAGRQSIVQSTMNLTMASSRHSAISCSGLPGSAE